MSEKHGTDWRNVEDGFPPMGEYVLVWLGHRPWESDSETVFATVMCRTTGGLRIVDCATGEQTSDAWHWSEFGPDDEKCENVTWWAPITVPGGWTKPPPYQSDTTASDEWAANLWRDVSPLPKANDD